MRNHHFITSIVIFVAGFALSAAINGRYLASIAKETLSNAEVPEVTGKSTQTSSTLQRWEYRLVRASKGGVLSGNKEYIDDELTRLGEQGFEICWVTQSSSDVGYYLTIILRRPKQ